LPVEDACHNFCPVTGAGGIVTKFYDNGMTAEAGLVSQRDKQARTGSGRADAPGISIKAILK
jgi:hypothetical protein